MSPPHSRDLHCAVTDVIVHGSSRCLLIDMIVFHPSWPCSYPAVTHVSRKWSPTKTAAMQRKSRTCVWTWITQPVTRWCVCWSWCCNWCCGCCVRNPQKKNWSDCSTRSWSCLDSFTVRYAHCHTQIHATLLLVVLLQLTKDLLSIWTPV